MTSIMVYRARHVIPVGRPPIESGAVAIEGDRIVAVGRARDLSVSSSATRDLGDRVLLPALVNAHTHLELSWCAGRAIEGAEFSDWVRSLLAARRTIAPDAARAAAEEAVRFVAARGTIAVGDLSNESWIASVVAPSRLGGVLFREMLGFRGSDAARLLDEAARSARTPTPHAIYSTSPALLVGLAEHARASGAPLSIHVAESEAESELVMRGTGPLAELLRDLGAWDDTWRPPGLTPVAALDALGVLSPRTLAVHCVQVSADDLALLRERGVTVVTCPRSNAQLGVGRAPVPAMVAAGIRVALGTDSLASAPDLDLFAEMAALRTEHPGLAPEEVLRMATLHGATALGLGSELGTLAPGKRAELLCVRLPDPAAEPLESVTHAPASVEWLPPRA